MKHYKIRDRTGYDDMSLDEVRWMIYKKTGCGQMK